MSGEEMNANNHPTSLIQSETKAVGSVKRSTYISFIKAGGG